MYLLDTNLISEIRKMPKGKCDQGLEQWVKTTSQNLMFTSAVVLMELERGILAMEHKDMAQGTILRTWFEKDVLPAFQSKILSARGLVGVALLIQQVQNLVAGFGVTQSQLVCEGFL